MNKPIVKPVFDEWWRAGTIVVTNDQQMRDVEQGFYAGIYTALGLVARFNRLPTNDAVAMVNNVMDECRSKLMPKTIKVVASINNERIKN